MIKLADGSMIYNGDDTFTDVLVNGNSYKDFLPIEVKIDPHGYGYAQLALNPVDGTRRQYIDGQYENYWVTGVVQLIP